MSPWPEFIKIVISAGSTILDIKRQRLDKIEYLHQYHHELSRLRSLYPKTKPTQPQTFGHEKNMPDKPDTTPPPNLQDPCATSRHNCPGKPTPSACLGIKVAYIPPRHVKSVRQRGGTSFIAPVAVHSRDFTVGRCEWWHTDAAVHCHVSRTFGGGEHGRSFACL